MPDSSSAANRRPVISLILGALALLIALFPFFARSLISISFLTLFLILPLTAFALGALALTLGLTARRASSISQAQTGVAASRSARITVIASVIIASLAALIGGFTAGTFFWFTSSLKAPESQPAGAVRIAFLGEPDRREMAVSAVALPDSTLLISGYSSLNDDPVSGRGFVMKADVAGRLVKLSHLTGDLGRIAVDDSGSILCAGIFQYPDSIDATTTRLALNRLSPDGDSLGTKIYSLPISASLTCLTSAGVGFFLCGAAVWDQADSLLQTSFATRVNADSDTLWWRSLPGDSAGLAVAMTPTRDGGCVVAGWSVADESEVAPIILTRLDSSGGLVWRRPTVTALEQSPVTLTESANGNLYLLSDRWNEKDQVVGVLTRLTASGDTLWTRVVTPTGYCMATDIIPWRNGGWLVTGWTPREEPVMNLSSQEVKNWDTWFISVVDSAGNPVSSFDGVQSNLAAWAVERTGERSCVLIGFGTQDETGPWGRILNQDAGVVYYRE